MQGINNFLLITRIAFWTLASTHIHAFVPNDIVAHFHGKKPYPSQNVLVAINFDLRFTNVLVADLHMQSFYPQTSRLSTLST